MADLGSVFFGGIGGVITSWVVAVFVDPKKERIRAYNVRIDDFLKRIESTHEQSITYWSSTERLLASEALIIMHKTAAFDQIYTLNELCSTEFQFDILAKELREYFGIVTGGKFQTKKFTSDISRIDEANAKLSEIRSTLLNSKISLNIYTICRVKVG